MAGLGGIALGGGGAVADIAGGDVHTCAVLAGGGQRCWGYNFYGQLGIGSTTQYGSGSALMASLPAVGLPGGASCAEVRGECVLRGARDGRRKG